MAICKTSSEIESLRGRFGGVYFKKDPTGQHIQTMPRSISKASMHRISGNPMQLYSRAAYANAISLLASFWITLMVVLGFTLIYAIFAIRYYYKTKKGEDKKLSGYQWHQHFNVTRVVKNKVIMARPPNAPNDLPVGISTSPNTKLSYVNFYEGGDYGGKKLYVAQESMWWLSWVYPKWLISKIPGQQGPEEYWEREDESPDGNYLPGQPQWGPAIWHID